MGMSLPGTTRKCRRRAVTSANGGLNRTLGRLRWRSESDPSRTSARGGRRTVLGLRSQQQATSIQNVSGLTQGPADPVSGRLYGAVDRLLDQSLAGIMVGGTGRDEGGSCPT